MDGAFDIHWQKPSADSTQLDHINNALQATLDPRTNNDVRQQAFQYLEQVKHQPDAPHNGFVLADAWKHNDAVRYFGLQLLEHALRYRWTDYSTEQTQQLRTWVKCLAGSVREQDALFLRNKIAQLWVDLAKRCWGDDWLDMDKLLGALWEKPMSEKGTANKLLVLTILETLSEDIVNKDNAVAGLRLDILGDALNDIMLTEGLYHASNEGKKEQRQIRSGDQGWLAKEFTFFADCMKQLRVSGQGELGQSMSFCASKTLHAIRPTVNWINLKAAVEVNAIDCLMLAFHVDDVQLQIASMEVLHALLSRPYGQHWHDPWLHLLQTALDMNNVFLLRQVFEHRQTAPGEDDESYTLQKKLSELLSVLADAVAQHYELFNLSMLLPFFDFLRVVLQEESLVVSIPVLHSWTKLITLPNDGIAYMATSMLLQTASARLLRYESLEESLDDVEELVVLYLAEDFDTVPERHAFLGNYRRYCVAMIQTIARMRPLEALSVLSRDSTDLLQTGPYTINRGFEAALFSKTNGSVLRFDAQCQALSSALKGCAQWTADASAYATTHDLDSNTEMIASEITRLLHEWRSRTMAVQIDDPDAAAQVLQIQVSILRIIKSDSSVVLRVVESLLDMALEDDPRHTTFSDAVKGFEALRVVEMQKLALSYPDVLLQAFAGLEQKVDSLISTHSTEPKLVWGYRAFLFMIIHRASAIDNDARLARLQQGLSPVRNAWHDAKLIASLSDLQSFCEIVGLADLPAFYDSHNFANIADWGFQSLGETGQARQNEMKAKGDGLPLRMTKSLLAATTEKLKNGSDKYDIACALWSDIIPTALPSLLMMIRQAQAFHNMANWSHLPDDLQGVIRRTLQDRFWQSGISNESRDDFYARISGSKTSYEGFASAVRGTLRNVREQSYHIIYLMTKFEEQFYGIEGLTESLSDALFADAPSLSANHLHALINLTTGLVQRCPPHHRASFLPPLLIHLFRCLDEKISSEWATIEQATLHEAEDEELSDEMRIESVLRQLTYSMVSFVPFLIDFDKTAPTTTQTNGHAETARPTMCDLVLSNPAVLEPLILFCTHALRMRDTRCCITICRVFRTIIPLFQSDDEPAPQVREFICTEVLKACITSLNEPYFADMQKDLAALIAQIVLLYSPRTATPRAVLLSLPDISEAKVDKIVSKIAKLANERQQRALILDLLEGVRGVSINEAGKIQGPKRGAKKAVPQQYMEVEPSATIVAGEETGLDSVAALFDEA